MKEISYHKPRSIDEALALKASLGEGARFIAGGTDVMVLKRHGKIDFDALISLRRIKELAGVEMRDGIVYLGAATTLTDVLDDPTLARHAPILLDAAKVMGATQMRNVATVGGNVMSAAPSGDTLCPLLSLNATCHLVSSQGERLVPMDEMFMGPRATVAQPAEILTRLSFPVPDHDGLPSAGAFTKIMRRAALELALVNLAAQVWLSPDRSRIEKTRVAAGVVAPTPVRLPAAEAALSGAAPSVEALERAAATIADSCSPRDSHRCAAWYREEMLRVMLTRTVASALARLGIDLGEDI